MMSNNAYACKRCNKIFFICTNSEFDEGAFDDYGNPKCGECLGWDKHINCINKQRVREAIKKHIEDEEHFRDVYSATPEQGDYHQKCITEFENLLKELGLK